MLLHIRSLKKVMTIAKSHSQKKIVNRKSQIVIRNSSVSD